MKRGGELKRKTPLKAKPTSGLIFTREPFSEPLSLYGGLPALPPIPGSLAKAAKKVTRRPKATKARKAAQGNPCLIRLPGCDGGGETTVLCHYRLAVYCGTGIKPPDTMAAYGCHVCHDIIDGRRPRPDGYTRNDVLLAFAEGVMRTQALPQP